jgi:signal transduction histidine kinase
MGYLPEGLGVTTSENTRDAEQRLRRLLDTNALLARVARDIGPALDVDSVLHTVLRGMRDLVDFRGGSVHLVDGHEVCVAAADPPVSEEVAAIRLPVGKGLSGRVVATGEALYSPDLDADDRVDQSLRSRGSNAGMRSYLAVPLICLGEVIGALQVDSPEVDAFDEEDRALLEGLAMLVAGAIETARRYEAVMELERLKSDFIARVSHELRTPLTIVSGFVSTLLTHSDTVDAEQRKHMLQRADAAVSRLSGLIEDLIMLARLETGVVLAVPEPVVLADVLEDVRRTAAYPDVIEVQCPPDLVVTTDATLLSRALSLLVDNAVKYGGGVRLRVDELTITVEDDGPGIADDVRDTVFELFTRGASTTAVPGLGLGLPMARTLVGVLGAELHLSSTDGGGTSVQITLPG